MRIKNLLFILMALPLALVACKPDTPVDEVKNPTVEVTAGEATENSLTFTVSSTEATNVAWMCVEATEEVPAAAVILQVGNAVEANKEVKCLANALEEDTEYTIVAVAKNSAGVVTTEINMSTNKLDPQTSSIKLKNGEASFKAEGGNGTIEYEIINAVPNGKFSHACKDTWVKDIKTGETSATFTVEANEGEARETIITIFYEDAKAEFKVKQEAKAADDGNDDGNDDGEDDVVADVKFTAKELYLEYLDMSEESGAYGYYVVLSDVPTTTSGYPDTNANGTYYIFQLYSTDSATFDKGILPNGTYKYATNFMAGTFDYESYSVTTANGEPTWLLYTDGTVTVSDGKIAAEITMEDGSKHYVVYEGNLTWGNFDDGGNEGPVMPEEFEATHTATKWLWGNASSYGNKYQVIGDNFSVDVHFPAQFAQENSLTAGDYIWTTTTLFGYNDFENEFTTRSLTVEGTAVAVDAGSAKVEANGDEYHIELSLLGRNGFTYMIEYNGKLNEKEEIENGNIVITSLSEGVYNSSYGFYTFKAANDNVTFDLLINDYQAQATTIYADDFMYAPMKSLTGSLGFFFVDSFKLDGVKYKPQTNSTMKVTGDGTNVEITLNLFMDSGDEMVVVYTGTVGGNGGNTGDDNTGDDNTGDDNTGDDNTGDDNTGDDNTGDDNTGDDNTGDDNTGDDNTGDDNTGDDNTGGVSYENWVFDASLNMSSLVVTLTDGSHTVTCALSTLSDGTFIIGDSGALYANNFTVNGTSADSASGTIIIDGNLKLTIDAVINDVKYTGTSTNTVI